MRASALGGGIPARPAALAGVATLMAASGCATAGGAGALASSEGPVVPWDVVPVVWSAVEVFERYGMPVAVADEHGGVVETGRFRIQIHWQGIPAERILQCPLLSAARGAEIYSRAFDVVMTMHARDIGNGSTRIRVSGVAESVDLGVGSPARIRCAVREEFRQLIADEIRRDVMHLPPRRRGG